MNDISIYIHIPFCLKKCDYCDFLSGPADAATRATYVQALVREIRSSEYAGREVRTIFFGGGTPTIMEVEQIEEILNNVRDTFQLAEDAEISIECNPGTATADKLKGLRALGINRLSIGLQSACDSELATLGRVHNYSQFQDTYRWAREAGFTNINIDIMSALPGQTLSSYQDTLDKVLELRPEHISSYSLIIEEGTPFYELYGDDGSTLHKHELQPGVIPLPDEDTEREMYYETGRRLEEAGYHHYEISNYALEGYECRHNLTYWTGDEYLSFGIGAASYMDHVRFSNIEDLYPYMKLLLKEESVYDEDYMGGDGQPEQTPYRCGFQRLSMRDRMEEFMIVGLRLMQGVSKSKWRSLFPEEIDEVFGGPIKKSVDEGLLLDDGENIRLTGRGIDVSNVVLGRFLL